jgi:hypothetical protein
VTPSPHRPYTAAAFVICRISQVRDSELVFPLPTEYGSSRSARSLQARKSADLNAGFRYGVCRSLRCTLSPRAVSGPYGGTLSPRPIPSPAPSRKAVETGGHRGWEWTGGRRPAEKPQKPIRKLLLYPPEVRGPNKSKNTGSHPGWQESPATGSGFISICYKPARA